ncbi:MAG: prevent-host-death family protein [Deltaproteobacteria bacterium]|nr:prevent-host-death family protein [Deltaproteobacteria bacterium]
MTRATTTGECADLGAAMKAAQRRPFVRLRGKGRSAFVLMTERRYQRMEAWLREAAEDAADIAAAREAEKEPGSIPWEKVKRDLRLE